MLQHLYQLPILTIGLGTFATLFLAAYVGFLVGRHIAGNEAKELNRGAVAGIVGVVALLLAFTLGFALSRFEDRRSATVLEANAVMTAFLRADLLPPAERDALREAIRTYAATRVFSLARDLPAAMEASLAAQEALWPLAVAMTEGRLEGAERAFVLSAVNEVLDDHLIRAAAATQRLPLPVLGLAVGLAAAAVFLAAFNEKTNRFPKTTFLLQSLGIAAVVTLILDFDNTNEGLIQIDSWIMTSTIADMDRILAGG